MKDWTFELVAGPFGLASEGPSWDGRYIYFSLIKGGVIMRYDPKTSECMEWRKMPNLSNGLMFDATGRLHACCVLSRSVVRLENNGQMTTLFDRFGKQRLNTPNDLAIERGGRIWFSNPWNEMNISETERQEMPDQSILRADPKPDGTWSVTRATFDTTFPNGVLLSADERTLYVSQQDYSEDEVRELRAYPITPDGSLGPYSALHQFGKDHRGVHRAIDGMCLDAEGNIVACAGWPKSGPGAMIYVFAPDGRVLETHPTPGPVPTNCTFGDPDLRSLYVTSWDGHLWRIRTERQGWNLYP